MAKFNRRCMAMKALKVVLFYIASFTYGIIMTLIGCFVCLALLISGHKPKRFHHVIYFEVGKNWGGVELGCFFLTDTTPSLHTKQHESGHGIQNVWLGPLMPFLVCIPSAARYWLYEFKTQKGRYIYATILFLVGCLIAAALIVPGAVFGLLPCWICGALVLTYFIYILIWLIVIEIPKYKEGKSPAYDSFWVEGWASSLGAKYFS